MKSGMEEKKMNDEVADFLYWDHLLDGISRERMIEMDNELNSWGWPEELGAVPESEKRREGIRRTVRSRIESEVGHKARLRYHHIHNLHRTEQEFEDWWDDQNAWWWWQSRARGELKELIAEVLERSSTEQIRQQAEEHAEKCTKERADHDGNQLIAPILFALGLVLGTFLGVLL